MLLQRLRRSQTAVSTSRIEAFSDGVFAIAITLLVLEIHVPKPLQAPGARSLADSLTLLWPSYAGYVISFLVVGIYWANHHYLFRLFRGTDHGLNLLNLLLLFWICFLPFPTAVISEYMNAPGQQRVATLFYLFSLLAPAVCWFLIWLYAIHRGRLIDPNLEPSFVESLTRLYGLSIVIYSASIAAAWWNPKIGLWASVLITGLYLLPPKQPVYRTGASSTL